LYRRIVKGPRRYCRCLHTRHRDDVHKLQEQLGNLRQQLGVLEGSVDALRIANARYIDEASQAREQRDQLALSLANFTVKQPTQKPSTGARMRSGPEAKSPSKRKT